MQINLHLVIAMFFRATFSVFLYTRNLSLLRFRYFVCFTHTVSLYSFLKSDFYI
jgi:hypothetical protein